MARGRRSCLARRSGRDGRMEEALDFCSELILWSQGPLESHISYDSITNNANTSVLSGEPYYTIFIILNLDL